MYMYMCPKSLIAHVLYILAMTPIGYSCIFNVLLYCYCNNDRINYFDSATITTTVYCFVHSFIATSACDGVCASCV